MCVGGGSWPVLNHPLQQGSLHARGHCLWALGPRAGMGMSWISWELSPSPTQPPYTKLPKGTCGLGTAHPSPLAMSMRCDNTAGPTALGKPGCSQGPRSEGTAEFRLRLSSSPGMWPWTSHVPLRAFPVSPSAHWGLFRCLLPKEAIRYVVL